MPLKFMYITNQPEIALIAENSGVEWIFIDLEIKGKAERQGHLDTVISRHSIDDVKRIKIVLKKAKLLVRVNPINLESELEIKQVIQNGADIVMLPYFKTQHEVETFIRYAGGKVKTCLLCETPEAVEIIDEIINIPGIDYIHIGLNDLHLGYKMKFMFELLADGTVEKLCQKFNAKGIPYGFGGIARLGQGGLPAEHIIAEHFRLGSEMAILSRTFCNTGKENSLDLITNIFETGIAEIRLFENSLAKEPHSYFIHNKQTITDKVQKIKGQL